MEPAFRKRPSSQKTLKKPSLVSGRWSERVVVERNLVLAVVVVVVGNEVGR